MFDDIYADDVDVEDGIAMLSLWLALLSLINPVRHTVLNQCTYVVIDEAVKLHWEQIWRFPSMEATPERMFCNLSKEV